MQTQSEINLEFRVVNFFIGLTRLSIIGLLVSLPACSTAGTYSSSPNNRDFLYMPHPKLEAPNKIRLHFANNELPMNLIVNSERHSGELRISSIVIEGCVSSNPNNRELNFSISSESMASVKGEYFSANLLSNMPTGQSCKIESLKLSLLTSEVISSSTPLSHRIRRYDFEFDSNGAATLKQNPENDLNLRNE